MKTGRKVLLVIAIVIGTLLLAMVIIAFSGMRYVRTMTVGPVDLSAVADGLHRGSFARGRFSYAVEVVVEDHRIVEARSPGTNPALDAAVKPILDRIVAEQSTTIDAVSGASLTTKAVAKAVENALMGTAAP